MSRFALAYIWLVVGLGAVIVAMAVARWAPADPLETFIGLTLAVFASMLKVRLPGLIGTISPGFVIVLLAMAKLDWAGTVAVGCLCGLVQTVWRPKTTPTAPQVLFNVAVMAISAAVAQAASARLGQTDLAVGLGVAGVTLLATNTLLVSGALCLMKRVAFAEVWRNVQFWSLPYYLAGGVVASMWVRAEWAGSLWIPGFVAASVYLMDLFYREFMRRTDRPA